MLIAECFRKHFLELIFKGEMLLALSKTCKLSITYLGKKKKLGKGLASGPLESYWMSFAVLSNRYSVPPILPLCSLGLWLCWGKLISTSVCFLSHTSWNKIVSRDANSFAKLSLICRIVPRHLRFSYDILKHLQTVSTKVCSRLLRCIEA